MHDARLHVLCPWCDKRVTTLAAVAAQRTDGRRETRGRHPDDRAGRRVPTGLAGYLLPLPGALGDEDLTPTPWTVAERGGARTATWRLNDGEPLPEGFRHEWADSRDATRVQPEPQRPAVYPVRKADLGTRYDPSAPVDSPVDLDARVTFRCNTHGCRGRSAGVVMLQARVTALFLGCVERTVDRIALPTK